MNLNQRCFNGAKQGRSPKIAAFDQIYDHHVLIFENIVIWID